MTFAKIALTSVSLMIAASAATANNVIVDLDEVDEFASMITLDSVTSEADGFVRFENMDGQVLGMVAVTEGANTRLPVGLTGVLDNDITAKLFHYGNPNPVATLELEVE